MYLLDTNIISYYLRRSSPSLEKRVNSALQNGACAISAITCAELRFGQAYLGLGDMRRLLIDSFLLRLPNLAWSIDAADQYGQLKAQLQRTGRLICELDTQIAAHALAENLILITHNTKHFERIEGLKMEDWMQ
ncbi:MAG: type II toxin-antitoxin system VapC family toxin [Methylophilaceae bacterium]|nr:type II toxin-antitoxin system VapC family toxin [Methylophilaceae bacterium]